MPRRPNELSDGDKNRLRDQSRKFFAEKDSAYFAALEAGKGIEEAAEIARQADEKAHPRRGGARPGAGRKPGTGRGRRDTARLEFCVSEDFKARFEALAAECGVTKVELLKSLFEAKQKR